MDWKNRLNNIQNKIKQQLHAKKIDDLESLYRLVSLIDKDNSGYLDRDEFQQFLSRLGIFLTTQELRAIYDVYDTNKDGNIAYSEFVQMIRTNISEKRLAVIKHAFVFLDQQKQGKLALSELFKQYRAEAHPRVRTRQKTADQVRQEFFDALSKKSADQQFINEPQFLDFYADVNATLPTEKEEYFVDLVLSTWGITSGSDYVSPERLDELEKTLYEKIRQKTQTKVDEGQTIKKAFKYFDAFDKGVIDIQQFAAALDKFGCVFNEREVNALFNKYDKDGSGKICYDEFSGSFAIMGSGVNKNSNPVFEIERTFKQQLLDKIKGELHKRLYGIREIQFCFIRNDKNKNGFLDREEFKWAMKEAGLTLTKTEETNLFKYLDKNFDDHVSYNEFLKIIRGQMNERRLIVVQQAFQQLDKEKAGVINFKDLIAAYDPTCVQEIKRTKQTPDELLKEFINLWGGLKKEGQVTQQEFEEFYHDLSANVDCDDLFILTVQKAFKLNNSITEGGARQSFLQDLWDKIHGEWVKRWRDTLSKFEGKDKNQTGIVSRDVFKQTLQEVGIVLSVNEELQLFNYLKQNQLDKVNYVDFIQLIRDKAPVFTENQQKVLKLTNSTILNGQEKFWFENLIEKMTGVWKMRFPELLNRFQNMDKGKTGFLQKETFRQVLKDVGVILTKIEEQAVLKVFDTGANGRINYNVFIKMFSE